MGLFGGDSSSSQETNIRTENVGAEGGGIAASYSTVNVLDAGAIAGALDFADSESDRAFGFGSEAFDFASGSAQNFLDATTSALDRAFQFANESLGLIETTVTRTQESTDTALNSALEQTNAALTSKDEAQSGGAQRLLYFGIAALAVVAFIGMRGFK